MARPDGDTLAPAPSRTEQERRVAGRDEGARVPRVQGCLQELFRAQNRVLSQSVSLAKRLELGHGALALFQVVTHTDAAIEDLRDLAAERSIALDAKDTIVDGWLAWARAFVEDLLSDTYEYGQSLILEHCHTLERTLLLRDVALDAGDHVLVRWCTECIEHRLPLIDRLARELARGRDESASHAVFRAIDALRFGVTKGASTS